jgi:hypothetical protein
VFCFLVFQRHLKYKTIFCGWKRKTDFLIPILGVYELRFFGKTDFFLYIFFLNHCNAIFFLQCNKNAKHYSMNRFDLYWDFECDKRSLFVVHVFMRTVFVDHSSFIIIFYERSWQFIQIFMTFDNYQP